MRKVALLVLLLAACLAIAAPAQARLKWDLPSAGVTHASDGMGLTNGSLSLHRVYASRHWMLDTFTIYGTQYTWTRPADSAFLKPGWTFESVVTCASCHSSIAPGGSTSDPNYPALYETLRLDDAEADGMASTTGQDAICEKCHDLVNGTTWSNAVHSSTQHRGAEGQCIMCHTQLPHGSGLPRMLGYAQDPSPYSSAAGGLQAIARQNYTPTSWRKRDCYSSCHGSGPGANPWPSGGSLAGIVRDTNNTPIPGATVRLWSGATTTTAVDGTYRLDNLGAGYSKIWVTAPGYTTHYVTLPITAGSITQLDATLDLVP